MRSRELSTWPNGVEMKYYQKLPCGHTVAIFSNQKVDWTPLLREGLESPSFTELRQRVLEMGCIKCENPPEPLDWPRSAGGFLASLVEKIS